MATWRLINVDVNQHRKIEVERVVIWISVLASVAYRTKLPTSANLYVHSRKWPDKEEKMDRLTEVKLKKIIFGVDRG